MYYTTTSLPARRYTNFEPNSTSGVATVHAIELLYIDQRALHLHSFSKSDQNFNIERSGVPMRCRLCTVSLRFAKKKKCPHLPCVKGITVSYMMRVMMITKQDKERIISDRAAVVISRKLSLTRCGPLKER